MAVIDLSRTITTTAVAPTASTTAAPTGATDGFLVRGAGRIRTLIAYAGTVSTCAVKVWFRDSDGDVWYEGASTDDLDALTPGGASAVNESRDWDVGAGSEVFFQITVITGGGTAGIKIQKVHL